MPLSQYRVIEVGTLPAAAYAGRLLADFGAEVIKVEPPAGDPSRRASPQLAPGAEGGGEGAPFAFLNFGKHSTTGDFRPLLTGADVLIASDPGLNLAAIRAAHPGLIVADVSWFGRSGPYAEYEGSDMVCRALAGLVHLVGPVEGPPLVAPDFQASTMGGLGAAIAILAALMARRRGESGRALEVSVLETAIAYAELNTADAFVRGEGQTRLGINRFWPTYPVGIYPVKDGWLGVTVVTPAQWRSFCAMLGLDDLGANPAFTTGIERMEHAAMIEGRFVPKLLERTVSEWFAECLKRRLPIVPVPDMADILANAEFRHRGAVVPIEVAGRTLHGVGSPLRLTRSPPHKGGKVLSLGTAIITPRSEIPAGHDTGAPMLAGRE